MNQNQENKLKMTRLTSLKKAREKTIKDIIKLTKSTKKIGTFLGSIIISNFFLINFVNGIFLKLIKNRAEMNPVTFRTTVLLTMLYTPLIALVWTSAQLIKPIKIISFESTKLVLVRVLYKITAFLLKPLEFLVFPVKMLIASLYFSSYKFYTFFGKNDYLRAPVATAIAVDLLIVFVGSLFKMSYMASFKPEENVFFAKIYGKFEQIMLALFLFKSSLTSTSIRLGLDSTEYRWIFYGLKLSANLGISWSYFNEIPYFNQTAHLLVGNLIGFNLCFFSIFEAFGESFESSFKIVVFVGPFFFFLYNLRLRMAYYNDSFESSRAPRIIKRLLMDGYKYDTVEEVFAETGVIKARFASKKRLKPVYLKILKEMVGLKASTSNLLSRKGTAGSLVSSRSTHRPETEPDYQDLETSANLLSERESTARDSEKRAKASRKDLEAGISRIVMKHLTDSHHRHFGGNYSKYIRIVWMLEKEMIVADLLKTLASMLPKRPRFKDLYFYYLAKEEVQKNFKRFYHRSGILRRDEEIGKEPISGSKLVKIETEIRNLNNVGADLAYCFRLKSRLSKMTGSILQFVEVNLKFIHCLRAPYKTYSELMALLKQLYHLKYKIAWEYEMVHRNARRVEFIHLVPYFYFLARCVNRHRSASNIFKLYKQRVAKNQKTLNMKVREITDLNILHNGMVLKIESQKFQFGRILGVYGDPVVEGLDPQALVGQSMDCLIPSEQHKAHQDSCDRFFNSKVSDFLGQNFTTFLKIPDTSYTCPISMVVKIMPASQDDFKFVVGIKILKLDSRLYIGLKSDLKVESYSTSMKLLFNNPDKYLLSDISISELSNKVYQKILGTQNPSKFKLLDNNQITGRAGSDGEEEEKELSGSNSMQRSQKSSTSPSKEMSPTRRSSQRKKTFMNYLMKTIFSNKDRDSSSQDGAGSHSFQGVLKFVHSLSGKVQKRKFDIDIVTRNYAYTDFSYTYLVMSINDDREIGKWMETHTLKRMTTIRETKTSLEEPELGKKFSLSAARNTRRGRRNETQIFGFTMDQDREERPSSIRDLSPASRIRNGGSERRLMKAAESETENRNQFNPFNSSKYINKNLGGDYVSSKSNVMSSMAEDSSVLESKMKHFNKRHTIRPIATISTVRSILGRPGETMRTHNQMAETQPLGPESKRPEDVSKITFGVEEQQRNLELTLSPTHNPQPHLSPTQNSNRLSSPSKSPTTSRNKNGYPLIHKQASISITISRATSSSNNNSKTSSQANSEFSTITDSEAAREEGVFSPMHVLTGGHTKCTISEQVGSGLCYGGDSSSSNLNYGLGNLDSDEVEFDEDEFRKTKHKSFDSLMKIINGIQKDKPTGTGSVMSGLDVQTDKKHYIFEDSLGKNVFFVEMVILLGLYLVAIFSSLAFNWYLEVSLDDHTKASSAKNRFFVKAGEFSAESLFYYSQILGEMSYAEGMVQRDRFAKFNQFEKFIGKAAQSPTKTALQASNITSDLELYHPFKAAKQVSKMLYLKQRIYLSLANNNYLRAEKELMFSNRLEVKEHTPEGTQYSQTLSYYQAMFHLYTHRMARLTNLPITGFRKSNNETNLLFFTANALNSFMPAMDQAVEADYKQLKEDYTSFRIRLFYLGLCILVGLMLILLLFSNLILFLQRGLFTYILDGFFNVSASEFDSRENELSTLQSVFDGFMMKGCCDDFMGFYGLNHVLASTLVDKNKRVMDQNSSRRFTDGCHCFSLLLVGFVISLFYLLQIAYSTSTLTSLNSYTDQILWGMKKELICKNLLQNQLVLYTALMERIVVSGRSKVNAGQPIEQFLAEFGARVRNDSNLIFNLSREDDGNQAYELTKNFLIKVENTSLCLSLPGLLNGGSWQKGDLNMLIKSAEELEERARSSQSSEYRVLCRGLDNGISDNGLVQSYFRVTQYLEQAVAQVLDSSEGALSTQRLLKDPEFTEFQFAFENVYYPAFLALTRTVYYQIQGMIYSGEADHTKDLIWLRNMILGLSIVIMLYSLVKIDELNRRVCFSFQLISIYSVLKNTSVKLRFLRVYKMNQKQL